ncbi:hypothetical protein, partial [Escherichia coli]|uniref:hypothetical protein n=1 Tax=Escherichia coli TaxID=562 RepID=UPI001E303462
KTSIFSHPVYLFLREFSLQDFRGGSSYTQGKNTQEQRMDLKTTWTTRKVRREKDPQNIRTKHQKRNQNASW